MEADVSTEHMEVKVEADTKDAVADDSTEHTEVEVKADTKGVPSEDAGVCCAKAKFYFVGDANLIRCRLSYEWIEPDSFWFCPEDQRTEYPWSLCFGESKWGYKDGGIKVGDRIVGWNPKCVV